MVVITHIVPETGNRTIQLVWGGGRRKKQENNNNLILIKNLIPVFDINIFPAFSRLQTLNDFFFYGSTEKINMCVCMFHKKDTIPKEDKCKYIIIYLLLWSFIKRQMIFNIQLQHNRTKGRKICHFQTHLHHRLRSAINAYFVFGMFFLLVVSCSFYLCRVIGEENKSLRIT